MSRLGVIPHIARHVRSNAVGYVALVAACTGTAYASSYVVASNRQIGPGTVAGHRTPSGIHANLVAGTISGRDLAPDSLKGGSVDEKTLDGRRIKGVNAATVAGIPPDQVGGRLGRTDFGPALCAVPDKTGKSPPPTDCAEVKIALSRPGRLLISASANAQGAGDGTCVVRSGPTDLQVTAMNVHLEQPGATTIARTFASDPLAAGDYDLKLHCAQQGIHWQAPMISAVALGNG